MRAERRNRRYLPEARLPDRHRDASATWQPRCKDAVAIIVAVPSHCAALAARSQLKPLRGARRAPGVGRPRASSSDTGKLPHQVAYGSAR